MDIYTTNCIHYQVCQRSSCHEKCQCFEERRQGKWMKDTEHEEHGQSSIVCSVCNHSVAYKTNFCPNCGADMRGGREQ